MPTQYIEVYSLQESNEEDVYETQGGYQPIKVRDDDFHRENEE